MGKPKIDNGSTTIDKTVIAVSVQQASRSSLVAHDAGGRSMSREMTNSRPIATSAVPLSVFIRLLLGLQVVDVSGKTSGSGEFG
jgi:hypothetical protein